jgi:hypothetical protein
VWSWNGAGWTVLTTVPAEIGAREDSLLVYDTARKTLILYGGRRGSSVFADTWEWNGQSWRQRPSDTGPGMVEHAAGAFDPRRGRFVVFGGGHRNRETPYRNTWEWNGVTWTQGAPQGQIPEARVGHAMTWSPRHGEVLLYGGFARQPFRDLWAWSGTLWRRLHEAGPGGTEGQRAAAGPPGLFVLPESVSGRRARAWLFADSWSQEGDDGPETLVGQGAIYDLTRGRLVVFGGHAPNRAAIGDDVWEFDGRAWTSRRRGARSERRLSAAGTRE